MSKCECGHAKSDHIHEEGACRPGFVCPSGCHAFATAVPPAFMHPLYWRMVCEALADGARVELVEADGLFFRVNYEDDPDTRRFLVPLWQAPQEAT